MDVFSLESIVETRSVFVPLKVILITALSLMLVTLIWSLSEELDYFKANYSDLTELEKSIFKSHANPTPVYISYLGNERFTFPRQHVDKIILFQNKPIIGSLTTKKLRKEYTWEVMQFFNNSSYFSWKESTWTHREAEYILRFYYRDQVVGKAYLCLEGCGMIDTRPFTPNIKFGALSDDGRRELDSLLADEEKWE